MPGFGQLKIKFKYIHAYPSRAGLEGCIKNFYWNHSENEIPIFPIQVSNCVWPSPRPESAEWPASTWEMTRAS